MSVVTTFELSNYLGGRKFTDVQEADAQAILDGVQSELERYLNRPVQMRRVLEEVTADISGRAYLKVTPIKAIHGFKRENEDTGELVNVPNYNFRYRKGSNFILVGAFNTIHVDYTGGMNTDMDPGVKLAIKRVAAREFTYKHDETVTVQNTEGRPPEDGPAPQPKGWTGDELVRFDRLRRRVIV
jgi:hypothetical protein